MELGFRELFLSLSLDPFVDREELLPEPFPGSEIVGMGTCPDWEGSWIDSFLEYEISGLDSCP